MNNYIDYDFYKESYGGTSVPQDSFTRLSLKASAYIDKITFGRIQKIYETDTESEGYDLPDSIKYAVCMAMEIQHKNQDTDNKTVVSESSNGYSVNYGNIKSVEKQMYDECKTFIPQLLLYKGFLEGVDTDDN